MRPIHLVRVGGKSRPAVILTRQTMLPLLRKVTVAPITSTVRGLFTEVPVGPANGLDHASVVSCDNIVTIDAADIGRRVGGLLPAQEEDLTLAISRAFDLVGTDG